jgi:hypothetical protein
MRTPRHSFEVTLLSSFMPKHVQNVDVMFRQLSHLVTGICSTSGHACAHPDPPWAHCSSCTLKLQRDAQGKIGTITCRRQTVTTVLRSPWKLAHMQGDKLLNLQGGRMEPAVLARAAAVLRFQCVTMSSGSADSVRRGAAGDGGERPAGWPGTGCGSCGALQWEGETDSMTRSHRIPASARPFQMTVRYKR